MDFSDKTDTDAPVQFLIGQLRADIAKVRDTVEKTEVMVKGLTGAFAAIVEQKVDTLADRVEKLEKQVRKLTPVPK